MLLAKMLYSAMPCLLPYAMLLLICWLPPSCFSRHFTTARRRYVTAEGQPRSCRRLLAYAAMLIFPPRAPASLMLKAMLSAAAAAAMVAAFLWRRPYYADDYDALFCGWRY